MITNNIAYFRQLKGFTQSEFAKRIFRSTAALVRWEDDVSIVPVPDAYRIAEDLDVTLDDLFQKKIPLEERFRVRADFYRSRHINHYEMLRKKGKKNGDH